MSDAQHNNEKSAADFDFNDQKVMWWSWKEAHQRAWSCGCHLSLGWLQNRGYMGDFLCGESAGAPDHNRPVKRSSFEQWLVRQYCVASYKNTFGQDLDTSPYTPQGQQIDSETAIIHDKNSQLTEVLNQFDPEKNDGIWQEGIGKIYFITRKPGARTIVPCEITGIVGTIVPGGEAQAIDKNGNLYALSQDTLIRTPSPVPVNFVALEPGPIVCPKESLDRIYKRVPGWDTVINPSAGITGSLPEGRKAFERRRYDSVAKNAHGNVSSVWGALADLDDVRSVQIAENVTNVDQTIRGVLVHGHSLFISIIGGADQAIAQTIYERKDGGCGYDGNTKTTLLIPTRNSITLQKKVIVYNRPPSVGAAVKVNIGKTDNTPGNIEELIKQAIQNNWNGLEEDDDSEEIPRVEIGETLLASRFYCSVRRVGIRFFDLLRIRVGRLQESGGSITWSDAVGFTLDEYPTLDDVNIKIVYGPDPEDVGPQGQFFHYDENGRLVLNPYVVQPVDNSGEFSFNESSEHIEANPEEESSDG